MAIVKLYHLGLTGGMPPMKKNHNPPKRGNVTGWSASASKRNVQFLRSVRPDSLTGFPFALTLTIRNCPETPADWHSLRRAFIKRLQRRGLIRLHWVTEWQRRGVPHFHGMAFFPEDSISSFEIVTQWLEVAGSYVCNRKGQHVNPVTDTLGWFKYLSKHAARGHLHYQRNPDSIPPHWHKTGRVWGYVGDWVRDDPIELDLDNQAFYRFRRLVRSWRVADARSNPLSIYADTANGGKVLLTSIPDAKRIKSAKTMLTCSKPDISRLRGVSEWISMDLALLFFDYLRAQGFRVDS